MTATTDVIERIISKLRDKATMFEEYEAVTKLLINSTGDEMERHLERRSELEVAIDSLSAEIKALQGGEPKLAEALRNSCARQGLAANLGAVYDISAEIRAIGSRIADMNDTVLHGMEEQREGLKAKIAQANKAPAARATKYYTEKTDAPTENLLSEKFRRG